MKKLRKSLLTFGRFMAKEDPNLDARPSLMMTIGVAMVERGPQYNLGNPNISNQLSSWVAAQRAKKVNFFIHFYWCFIQFYW